LGIQGAKRSVLEDMRAAERSGEEQKRLIGEQKRAVKSNRGCREEEGDRIR
jgi:hypothetical protein